MKTEHILVIRFSAMGDVAMTVPVIQSLAKQYPKVRITVLSRPFARPFFEDLAPNVGFMEADIKGEYKGVTGLNALYRRLIAKQFTAIADLHSVLRSDYLRMRFNLDNFNQIKIIGKLFDSSERIIVATDAGREGELIFRYLYVWAETVKEMRAKARNKRFFFMMSKYADRKSVV